VERFFAPGEEFEGFGDFERCDEVDYGSQDANGVAGFFEAVAVCRGFEEAGEARRETGADGHGDAVTGDSCGVNPGLGGLDRIIIHEEAGLEIVGAVEDQIEAGEQLGGVAGV